LDPGELQVQSIAERLDEQRLAQPGEAFEQRVPVGEQADQDVLHQLRLADECPGHFRLEAVEHVREGAELLFE
jgi:hypothetical protein